MSQKEINNLKLIAERLEQRANDDSILPTGYLGRFSDIYNSWMKAGIIYYNIYDFYKAKECFEKSYNFLKLYENIENEKNYNLPILINLCDEKNNNKNTYNIKSKLTYSSKLFSLNLIKILEKNNSKLTLVLRNDLNNFIKNNNYSVDTLYFIEIIMNPFFIIVLLSIIYMII